MFPIEGKENIFTDINRVGVAVSGGADSMALLLWAKQYFEVFAATVDHQLRQSSSHEAQQVQKWCKAQNIPHTILKVTTNNTASATRNNRYIALAQWYNQHNLDALLLGHHQQDQAETLLLRLQRGSGLQGLCGMQTDTQNYGMRLLRPLLNIAPQHLKNWLITANQPWFEDPSNQQQKSDRNTLRIALQHTPLERLSNTCTHLQRAQKAITYYVDQFLAQHCTYDKKYTVNRIAFEALPEEVALRALSQMLCHVGQKNYPPRFERLLNVYRATKPIKSYDCRILRKKDTLLIEPLKT